MIAHQNHLDLDFLGKPRFNDANFDAKTFLHKNAQSAESAAAILVEKPGFLFNCIADVTDESPALDHYLGHEHKNNYVFIYIYEFGVYGICKKTTLVFLLTKLFLDLELDRVMTKEPSNNVSFQRHNLKEINTYLNQPLDNYPYVYEYAINVVNALENYCNHRRISPYAYRFRNNYQTYLFYQGNALMHMGLFVNNQSKLIKSCGSLYFFNMDYTDDLILLPPHHYEIIYINTNGYFYMPYHYDDDEERDAFIDIMQTI